MQLENCPLLAAVQQGPHGRAQGMAAEVARDIGRHTIPRPQFKCQHPLGLSGCVVCGAQEGSAPEWRCWWLSLGIGLRSPKNDRGLSRRICATPVTLRAISASASASRRGLKRVAKELAPHTESMVAVLIVALGLQVLGTVLLAIEVGAAHRRWVAKFRQPHISGNSDTDLPGLRIFTTGWVSGPPGETVEQRLDRLEGQQRETAKSLAEAVHRLETATIPKEAHRAAAEVEARLQPLVVDTLEYLAGLGSRPRWRPWWLGPGLLVVGIVLGGLAAVLAV